MSSRQSRPLALAAGGFTLVELLVTLLVLALVTSIMAQAMAQFFRIDDLLATRALPAQADAVRVDWIRQALVALQPPDPAGHNTFSGSARHLAGTSGNPLSQSPAGYGRLDLSLVFDAQSGQTGLQALILGQSDPVTLLRWPGDEGRFAYYDAKGNRFDSWPPPQGIAKPLPSMIALESGMDSPAVIVATPLITNDENPTRIEVEQL